MLRKQNKQRIKLNNQTLEKDYCVVKGHGNTLIGRNITVYGQNNKLEGPDNEAIGNNNRLDGPRCKAKGHYNVLYGKDCTEKGWQNTIYKRGFYTEAKGSGSSRKVVKMAVDNVITSSPTFMTGSNVVRQRVIGALVLPPDARKITFNDISLSWRDKDGNRTAIRDTSEVTSVNGIPIRVYKQSLYYTNHGEWTLPTSELPPSRLFSRVSANRTSASGKLFIPVDAQSILFNGTRFQWKDKDGRLMVISDTSDLTSVNGVHIHTYKAILLGNYSLKAVGDLYIPAAATKISFDSNHNLQWVVDHGQYEICDTSEVTWVNGIPIKVYKASLPKKVLVDELARVERTHRSSSSSSSSNSRTSRRTCQHNRERYFCKECDGKGICKHGRKNYECKECGGRIEEYSSHGGDVSLIVGNCGARVNIRRCVGPITLSEHANHIFWKGDLLTWTVGDVYDNRIEDTSRVTTVNKVPIQIYKRLVLVGCSMQGNKVGRLRIATGATDIVFYEDTLVFKLDGCYFMFTKTSGITHINDMPIQVCKDSLQDAFAPMNRSSSSSSNIIKKITIDDASDTIVTGMVRLIQPRGTDTRAMPRMYMVYLFLSESKDGRMPWAIRRDHLDLVTLQCGRVTVDAMNAQTVEAESRWVTTYKPVPNFQCRSVVCMAVPTENHVAFTTFIETEAKYTQDVYYLTRVVPSSVGVVAASAPYTSVRAKERSSSLSRPIMVYYRNIPVPQENVEASQPTAMEVDSDPFAAIKEANDQDMTEADLEEEHCAVCLDKRGNVVLLPCGHICVCPTCARKLKLCPICPICRTPIAKAHVVYKS